MLKILNLEKIINDKLKMIKKYKCNNLIDTFNQCWKRIRIDLYYKGLKDKNKGR